MHLNVLLRKREIKQPVYVYLPPAMLVMKSQMQLILVAGVLDRRQMR